MDKQERAPKIGNQPPKNTPQNYIKASAKYHDIKRHPKTGQFGK